MVNPIQINVSTSVYCCEICGLIYQYPFQVAKCKQKHFEDKKGMCDWCVIPNCKEKGTKDSCTNFMPSGK